MTREELRAVAELRVFAGKPSDDAEYNSRQIDFELDKYRGILLPDWIRKNPDIPPHVLKRYDCQTLTSELPVCLTDECYSRYYLQLPSTVMQLEHDLGVYRVVRQAGFKSLDRMHVGEQDILRHSRFAKWSEDNPAFAVFGNDKAYVFGLKSTKHTFYVDIIESTTDSYADTDQYPIPEELCAPLIDAVVAAGLQQVNGVADMQDDGKET